MLDLLKEVTRGPGPGASIDAARQEAHENGVVSAYDRVNPAARLDCLRVVFRPGPSKAAKPMAGEPFSPSSGRVFRVLVE